MNEEKSAGCDTRAATLQCSLAQNSHLIQGVRGGEGEGWGGGREMCDGNQRLVILSRDDRDTHTHKYRVTTLLTTWECKKKKEGENESF